MEDASFGQTLTADNWQSTTSQGAFSGIEPMYRIYRSCNSVSDRLSDISVYLDNFSACDTQCHQRIYIQRVIYSRI